jgi:hypothetical protein
MPLHSSGLMEGEKPREAQADHPALFQALVIRLSVCDSVPGLLAFARFALFLSGFVWHYLDTLYSSSRTSTQIAPSLQYPHPNKALMSSVI